MEQFLSMHSGEQFAIIERLRALIKTTAPGAAENIMWSTPWYYLNNRPYVYIATASDHINFGFAFGAQLKSNLLEGTGKNTRHIKIRSLEQIDHEEKEYISLLKEATARK
jgi:hypothetical protein